MKLFNWQRVWVITKHTQDAGRVWFTHVWRCHLPGVPCFDGYVTSGIYVYRYWSFPDG